ncbi:MAG: hypothetical protein Q8S84_00255 [bacterium]|nr:hypothetical protein [bacterium]
MHFSIQSLANQLFQSDFSHKSYSNIDGAMTGKSVYQNNRGV